MKITLFFINFFLLSIMLKAQNNYAEMKEKRNNNYVQWSKNQNWKHHYFEWQQQANDDYAKWEEESGWSDTDVNADDNITDANVAEIENQIENLTGELEDLQAVTPPTQQNQQIQDLQQQIARLQAENSQLQNASSSTRVKDIKIWAVVVGIAKYSNPDLVLNYCDDDAYKIYGFLKSPEGGAVPEKRIKLLIDEEANGNDIKNAINDFSQQASSDDVLLFYYSGHGSPNALLGRDFNTNQAGVVSHQYIQQQIENSQAKHKFCIIDACHSGNVFRIETPQNNQPSYCSASRANKTAKSISALETSEMFYETWQQTGKGTVYILSSKGEEQSLETQDKRQGIFSFFLIEALRGKADYNQDKIISVTEVFDYTHKKVISQSNYRQTPVILGNYEHNMPISIVRE